MEKILASVAEAFKKAQPLTYSESQEVRISMELCDRSHMELAMKKIYDKAGMVMPKELLETLGDDEFDVRMACMKAIVGVMEGK